MIWLLTAGMQSVVAQSEQSDFFYDRQWHLTGQEIIGRVTAFTIDINVEPVWERTLKDGQTKIRGQGTYIAIVDGDLPIARQSATTQTLAHPDLIENISTQHSVDYYPSVIDPDGHATAVAGIAAARGYNRIGVRGVAPWARVYGLNILGIPDGDRSISAITRDIATLDAMVRHTTITAVSNNSWGSVPPFQPSGSRLRAWEMAIETGIEDGFHGKGVVYTWAAGNNRCISRRISSNRYEQVCNIDNSNYDGRAKHYATVAVCAVDYRGRHATYSELGANLWVCAPSRDAIFNPTFGINQFTRGITTTYRGIFRGVYDHYFYRPIFGGTSAAAPMVSGVVALMRQVNPSLSWRDVKLILANSARQNDFTDDGWAQGAVKYGSSSDDVEARYHFNHKYGFGLVDAEKAVEMAEGWINLPPVAPYTEVSTSNLSLMLSADNPVINSDISVQSDINFIEYMEIPIRLIHPLIQDLSVELISPSGAISSLFIPSTHPISSNSSYAVNTSSRGSSWRFGSSVHLGEDPSGIWRLRFEDTRATTGTLIAWGVRIRGYRIKMDATPAVGLSDENVAETPLTLSLIGASWEKDLQSSDFSLRNAPAGLRIASVRRTSDTQVELNLALDKGFAQDYLFQVEATTSTVPNIRNPLISNDIPIVWETNEAPILEIVASPERAIELGGTADVVVSVADNNFDVGDRVTLTAKSSSRTIVSVTTSAQTDNITNDASITFTLTAEQNGEATVTFTATDNNGLKDSETVSVQVNAPPTITSFDDTVSVKEGREQTIAVSVSDADTDDSLTLSLTAMDENQDIVELVTTNVIVMTNGSVARDAQALKIKGLKAGVATLNITVSDAHTESVAASVSVTVERNTAPTIIGIPEQSIRLLEGTETTLNVVINDADDDSLSVRIDTGNSLIATATIITTDGATRTLEVSGVGAGSATIMVTVNDGRGLSNSRILEEFEVRVEANTKPTIMITPPTVPTMQLNDMTDVVVSVADDNFDVGDSVTLEAMSSSRTIVSVTTSVETDDITTNTSITFTLTAEQSGEAVITFTATDSNESTNSKTVSVRVNASPTITSFDNTVSVKEGREQTIAVSVSDADTDDSLTLSLTAMNENQDVVELVTTSVMVMTNGSVTRDAQTLKIKGLKAGVATLNITVSDAHTESVSASVSVTVERNTAPTIIGIPEQPIKLLEGTETTLNVVINDADVDDSLSVRIDTGNSLIATATIIATDGATRTLEVSGVGAGSATIMVTVNDGRGLSNSRISEEFEVRVEANTKPTIMITPPTVPTMQLNDMTDVVVSVADDNFDLGDSVTLEAMSSSRTIISVATSAETDDITTNTSITFTLTAEQSGEAVITFTATDSNESTNSKTVSVRVNTPPTITSFDNTVSVKEGREQAIAVSVSDADTDDSLTLSLTAMDENQDVVELVTTSVMVMTNGSVTRDAQTLKIKGLKAGVATLNITVSDEHTESVSASVSVTVERNTAPTIIGIPEQPIKLLEGTETTLNVTINDADDDDSPSVSIDTGNSLIATATIIATDGATRTLEVSGVGAGSATIMVTVNDGRGLSNSRISEEFEVRVEANTKPTIMITPSLDQTLSLNSTAHIVVSVADDNFDLDDIVTLEAMSSSRTIVSVTTSAETDDITTNTSITFTLTAEQSGEAVITFTATDSNESTNSKTVSVRVNASPTITSFDNTVSVKEGREQTIAVLVSDADTDDSLTLSLTAIDENQDVVELVTTSVMVMTNGSVTRDAQTLKIKGLKAGVATLNITVSDEHTESVSASVLVTVERNTAPTIIGIPEQPIKLLEGTETTLNVTINDADDDDSLSVSIDTGNSLIATATIIATDGATRTLEVSGVGAGSATIMVTVNDGRGLSNSRISEEFEVRVEANTKPTIMITPSLDQTLSLNSTAHIVVSVADDNFNLGDSVTLEAMSSSRTIVSVTTSAETDDITTNTSITFTLTAEQNGEAVITFTATDSNESTNSKTVSVRVNTPPQVVFERVPSKPIVATVGEAFRLETGGYFSDADNDVLTYSIVVDPNNLSYNFSTTGTLTFTPVNASTNTAGFTVIVSASDGKGGTAQATFTLLIDAKLEGRVIITPDTTDKWLLNTTSTIMDANGIAETNYQWYRNDAMISEATNNTYEIPDNRNGRATGTRYRLDVMILDSLGRKETTQSNTITIANEEPVIAGQITVLPSPVEEGQEAVITVPASDANYDSLAYDWRVTSAHNGITVSGNPATLITSPDFVDAASTKTTVNLEVAVGDGSAATTGMVSVVVRKINNGSVTLGISIKVGSSATTLTARVLSDDPDGGTSGTVVYQWQVCEGSGGRCLPGRQWQNINEATETTYIISGSRILVGNDSFSLVEDSSIFRIKATYSDGQRYKENVYSAGRIYTTRPVLRIRSRVFLESPLQ